MYFFKKQKNDGDWYNLILFWNDEKDVNKVILIRSDVVINYDSNKETLRFYLEGHDTEIYNIKDGLSKSQLNRFVNKYGLLSNFSNQFTFKGKVIDLKYTHLFMGDIYDKDVARGTWLNGYKILTVFVGDENCEDYKGDDWDKVPACQNAGRVHDKYVKKQLDFLLDPNIIYKENNDNISIDAIKQGLRPKGWLTVHGETNPVFLNDSINDFVYNKLRILQVRYR